MKRFFTGMLLMVVAATAFVGCNPEYTKYDGPMYVMFADTLSTYYVGDKGEAFEVPVVATQTVDYDRNFGIEAVLSDDTDAANGLHYTLESNTITIKAGERVGNVVIEGNYDSLDNTTEDGDAPVLKLRIVSSSDTDWELYGVETKVELRKRCPFDVNNFTGYCLVYSLFLADNTEAQEYPRLVKTEAVEGEENTILVKGMLFDGYDIKMKFYPDDPKGPRVELVGTQEIGNTDLTMTFAAPYTDKRIWAETYPGVPSELFICNRYALPVVYLYCAEQGLVAEIEAMEWLTDAQAEEYL